jgi:hypothetical protein
MAMYQLNMARDQVLTLEKRRLWFRWMFAYLAVSVLVISGLAYWLTRTMVDLSARSEALDAREKILLSQRPGVRDVDGCLKKVSSEMTGLTASLDAVKQFKAMGQKSAAILLGFAESLPPGVELGRLVLDGDGGTVKIEVYVPAYMKLDNGLTLPNVILRWESALLLTNRVRQIASENSSRISFEGRDYLNWRFTGELERGNP